VLFCIAETLCPSKDKYTTQGYDAQFGANTLGHLLLIRKLYHLLVSSTTPDRPARVLWASSSLYSRCASPFNYEALKDTPARSQRYITPQTLYESSKFAIVQLGLRMSRTTFKDDGVLVILVDTRVEVENSPSKNTAMKFVGQVSALTPWPVLPKGCSLINHLVHPSVESSRPTSMRVHAPRLRYMESTLFLRSRSANPPQLLKMR